jgi:hypothetical protein
LDIGVEVCSVMKKTNCSEQVKCPVTAKSEAIDEYKEMAVTLVNKVVDRTRKRIIGKRGPRWRKRHKGLTQKISQIWERPIFLPLPKSGPISAVRANGHAPC